MSRSTYEDGVRDACQYLSEKFDQPTLAYDLARAFGVRLSSAPEGGAP